MFDDVQHELLPDDSENPPQPLDSEDPPMLEVLKFFRAPQGFRRAIARAHKSDRPCFCDSAYDS
jgi:hypothetical protein